MTMRPPIKLFVSAGPDLEAERDAIGRVVAELPVTVGWEIGRTPWAGQDTAETTVHVAPYNCDLFIFMLGRDIVAPTGSEWREAQTVQHPILPLLKRVPRTPAGLSFERIAMGLWVPFATAADVERLVRRWLIDDLLNRQAHYGLVLAEVEALVAAAAGLKAASGATVSAGKDEGLGAGGAGIIMPTVN